VGCEVLRKSFAVALVVSGLIALGCTSPTDPSEPEGFGERPIPGGPNKTIEPDHPPVPPKPQEAPPGTKLLTMTVLASHGPVKITGTITGQRANGAPSESFNGDIPGSTGGTWYGHLYFDPRGRQVGVYAQITYKGPELERDKDLILGCKWEEQGWNAITTANQPGSRVHECAYKTRSR
jgi:hypothetical protein